MDYRCFKKNLVWFICDISKLPKNVSFLLNIKLGLGKYATFYPGSKKCLFLATFFNSPSVNFWHFGLISFKQWIIAALKNLVWSFCDTFTLPKIVVFLLYLKLVVSEFSTFYPCSKNVWFSLHFKAWFQWNCDKFYLFSFKHWTIVALKN
jgi:hypothetical protein